MIRKLDAGNYNDSETITIKVPLTVPYAVNSRDFERVNGEFEYKGEFYRLVKQKLSQDTLFIICVKDHENKRIHEALSGFVKTFSDKPVDIPSNAKTGISFIKDYIATDFKLASLAQGWKSALDFPTVEDPVVLFFLPILSPPPEA